MVGVPASIFMWMNVGQSLLIILVTFILPETKGIVLCDKISESKVIDNNTGSSSTNADTPRELLEEEER
jgi:hypothetical protein